jgi:hypothetical protein
MSNVLYNWRKVDWALMPLGFGVVPRFLSISFTPLVSSSTSLFLLTSPGQWRRSGRKLNTQRQLSPPLFSTPSGFLEFGSPNRPFKVDPAAKRSPDLERTVLKRSLLKKPRFLLSSATPEEEQEANFAGSTRPGTRAGII